MVAVSTFQMVTSINCLEIIVIKCAIYMMCPSSVLEVVNILKYIKLSHWFKLVSSRNL
jgi:hypothetical protein